MKKPNSLHVYRFCSSASLSAHAYMSMLLKHISWRNSGSSMQIFILLLCTISMPFAAYAQKPAISLEQVRNGSASAPVSPGEWQNGNLNASQAHFVESHSIPYRALMIKMPIGETVTLELGFDIKHSGRNALDYLTHYDRLQPHGQFLNGGLHPAQEVIDPTLGTSFTLATSPKSEFTIPAPYGGATTGLEATAVTSYNTKVEANKKVMTLWGGTITNIVYLSPYGDLTASQSEQKIAVTFTVTHASPVLAWGGHIASRQDWGSDANGIPLSAGGISGSPYHMRVLGWSLGNLGQQDRSLAAAAVIPPPGCDLTGDNQACINQSKQYSTAVVADTYTWSLIDNTSGASITGGQGTTTLTVNSGTQAGAYSVKLVTVKNGITSTDDCRIVVTVTNPQTNDVTDREHCPGESGSAINFSGTAGATFHWSSDVNVGFGTSGTGNIPSYTAIANNTNAAIVATVTVYASLNGCDGPSQTFTVTVNPTPTISTPAIGDICEGTTSASLSYSGVTGGANQYKIVWNTDAVNAGLVNNGYAALPASPVPISGTGSLAPATYNGVLYVKNSTTGCESAGDAVSLTVNPNPAANAGADPDEQCINPGGNEFVLNGSGSNGTASWTVLSNPNSLTVDFDNANAFNTSVTISGGHGSVTLRLTVTSQFDPSCGSVSDEVVVTINDKPTAPAVDYIPPACDETVFKVKVLNPVAGATYYIVDKNGGNSASILAVSGQEVIFENRPAGSGYQVSVTNSSGCSSGTNDCGVSTASISRQSLNSSARMDISAEVVDAKLLAYPMPFEQKMNLTYQIKKDGSYSVNLYDMSGKMIRTLKIGNSKAGVIENIEVDGTDLKNGMYLIVVSDGNKRQTIRVIKKQ